MGHRSAKRLIALKKHGKAIAVNLPSQMLKEYNYSCPICLASKKRRKILSGSTQVDPAIFVPTFRKGGVVYFDTSRHLFIRIQRYLAQLTVHRALSC